MKEDGVVVIRFEGVNGSPLVSGIGIRRPPSDSGTLVHFICVNGFSKLGGLSIFISEF